MTRWWAFLFVVAGVVGAMTWVFANGGTAWLPRITDPVCMPESPAASSPELPESGELVGLSAELVVDGLDSPTDMVQLPGRDMLLVSEKPGRIVAVQNGIVLDPPVLDISESVLDNWNERGLLTMTLHPAFAETCELFLFYTDLSGHSNLVSVIVDGTDMPSIDVRSMRSVLFIAQDHQYHQSGSMEFGPDGYLWVSIGDGGLTHPENAQNLRSIKGSVLRIDLGERPFGIPPDNPVEGSPIWATGLRNPWRISIDHDSRTAYIPDPGHADFDEVNIVSIDVAGKNYGWPVVEGLSCFRAESCESEGFTPPTFAYEHDGTICALVGGSVYRGEAMPELDGHYFYADFCRGWVKSFRYVDGTLSEEQDWPGLSLTTNLTSFATDLSGELYFTSLEGGLWKIVPVRG